MKKKLLITLGCSLTEGLGCYGDNVPAEDIVSINKGIISEKYKKRFQEYGWPKTLYNLLNYDELINLGKMGYSTSGNLKLFSETYLDKDLSEYEVLVIWQLPQSSRISLYIYDDCRTEYRVNNFMLNEDDNFTKEIINKVKHPWEAGIREQIFCIKMMEQICENNNWNLIVLPTAIETYEKLNELYSSQYFLSQPLDWNEFPKDKEHVSPICKHPNESGYKFIGEKIFELIKKDLNHLINKKI